jgi:hypothetical protein
LAQKHCLEKPWLGANPSVFLRKLPVMLDTHKNLASLISDMHRSCQNFQSYAKSAIKALVRLE